MKAMGIVTIFGGGILLFAAAIAFCEFVEWLFSPAAKEQK